MEDTINGTEESKERKCKIYWLLENNKLTIFPKSGRVKSFKTGL